MTTTMSYSENSIFLHMYKSAVKKSSGMGTFFVLVSFIFFPMQYLLELSTVIPVYNNYHPESIGSISSFFGNPQIYTPVIGIFFIVFMLLYSILMNVTLNKYMHDRRAVDTYHALPVKRHTMLRANTLAVLTWVLVPLFIWFVIISIGNSALPLTEQASLMAIWAEYLKFVAILALLQALTAFTNSLLTGGYNALLGTLVLNFIVLAILGIFIMMFSYYLYGYAEDVELIMEYGLWSSPISLTYTSLFWDRSFADMFTEYNIVAYLWGALSVPLHLLAEMFYRKRQSEQAQTASTKNTLYRVIILFTSFAGGILFAFMLSAMFGIHYFENTVSMTSIILTLTGSLISYIATKAIYTRNFRFSKSDISFGAICMSTPILLLVILITGGFGYEQRVPAIEDVAAVTIDYNGEYGYMRAMREDEGRYYDTRYRAETVLMSEEGKELILSLHSDIVQEYADKTAPDYDSYFYDNGIDITYTLTNGDKMYRRYYNYSDDISHDKMYALSDLAEYNAQHNPLLVAEEDKISSYIINNGINTRGESVPAQQAEAMHEAILKDMQSISTKERVAEKGVPLAIIEIYYKEPERSADSIDINPNVRYYSEVFYAVTESSVNTIEAINDLGLSHLLENDANELSEVYLYHEYSYYDTIPYISSLGDGMYYDSSMMYQSDTLHLTEIEDMELLIEKSTYLMDRSDFENIVRVTFAGDETMANYYVSIKDLSLDMQQELTAMYSHYDNILS